MYLVGRGVLEDDDCPRQCQSRGRRRSHHDQLRDWRNYERTGVKGNYASWF